MLLLLTLLHKGCQISFYEAQADTWTARIVDEWQRVKELPVVCAPHQTPRQALEILSQQAPEQHPCRIHIIDEDQSLGTTGAVYVGTLGLRGGGKTSNNKVHAPRCHYPHCITGGENSDDEPDGEVLSGGYRFKRSNTNEWCVEMTQEVARQVATHRLSIQTPLRVFTGVVVSIEDSLFGSLTPRFPLSTRADYAMTLAANDIRDADEWEFHDCDHNCDSTEWRGCIVPKISHDKIIARRTKRREARKAKRKKQLVRKVIAETANANHVSKSSSEQLESVLHGLSTPQNARQTRTKVYIRTSPVVHVDVNTAEAVFNRYQAQVVPTEINISTGAEQLDETLHPSWNHTHGVASLAPSGDNPTDTQDLSGSNDSIERGCKRIKWLSDMVMARLEVENRSENVSNPSHTHFSGATQQEDSNSIALTLNLPSEEDRASRSFEDRSQQEGKKKQDAIAQLLLDSLESAN